MKSLIARQWRPHHFVCRFTKFGTKLKNIRESLREKHREGSVFWFTSITELPVFFNSINDSADSATFVFFMHLFDKSAARKPRMLAG